MIDEPLTTRAPSRLHLRTLGTGDAEAFAAHVAGDVEHLREHLPWADSAATLEGARAFLASYARQEDGRVLVAGAFADDGLAGGALLLHHEPAWGTIEIGCWVTSAAQGLGVARAACAALIAYARDDLGVHRVQWSCTTANPRSRKLAERLGFEYEGTLRSAYLLHGERYDLDVLSLVGEELRRPA